MEDDARVGDRLNTGQEEIKTKLRRNRPCPPRAARPAGVPYRSLSLHFSSLLRLTRPALADGYLDAALEPAQWPAVLEHTARKLGSVGMDLHLLRQGVSWASYIGTQPPEVLNEYNERFIHREPRSLTLQHLRPGQVVTDLDFVDRETMRTHEYYADFLRRNGMGHCIAAAPLCSGGNQAYFGAHFAYGEDPSDAERIAFVRALQPYLARAVRKLAVRC